MDPKDYFIKPSSTSQKQYEALRAFFVDNLSAKQVAAQFNYQLRAFTSLVSAFRDRLHKDSLVDYFFQVKKPGRKYKDNTNIISDTIIELRKKNYSIPEIKSFMDSKNLNVSEKYIYLVLHKNGFARLPRRNKEYKTTLELPRIEAEKSYMLNEFAFNNFSTTNAGLLLFIPYIEHYKIAQAIQESSYPETSMLDKLSSILAFLALKLSNIRRYSIDDLWCMDRGSGLFAKLNVLPKSAWYSSYSHRITIDMNRSFLKSLHKIWKDNNLLTDTVNLDFVTIPYWGDSSHLENNWSGKRGKSLASMLSVLAQEPDTGIIDYGNTDILHKNEHAVVLEFLDFYRTDNSVNDLKYLVFDSKFTNYENLRKLDNEQIKFITIRRRGKNIVDKINSLSPASFNTLRIMNSDGKGRTLKVKDEIVSLPAYSGEIRQIVITGHGKIKPAIIITNDFDLETSKIVRKYCRRWIVEKTISEQTEFFHLNRLSSSMVIKVDFDLTMSILAHNLYRLFAYDSDRYSHFTSVRLFEKFISNSGEVSFENNSVYIKLKKKRDLPEILTIMKKYQDLKIPWLNNMTIKYSALSYS